MIIEFILGGIVVGAVAGMLLGRFAKAVGCFFLLLGTLPLGVLYVYETYLYTRGDTSSMGLASMLALVAFVPFGLTTCLTGIVRGR